MWIRTSTHAPAQVLILPTKYAYAPKQEISESPMSYSQERLPVLKELGVGVLTMGLISTITIFIFHSLKKATKTVAGLISRC